MVSVGRSFVWGRWVDGGVMKRRRGGAVGRARHYRCRDRLELWVIAVLIGRHDVFHIQSTSRVIPAVVGLRVTMTKRRPPHFSHASGIDGPCASSKPHLPPMFSAAGAGLSAVQQMREATGADPDSPDRRRPSSRRCIGVGGHSEPLLRGGPAAPLRLLHVIWCVEPTLAYRQELA